MKKLYTLLDENDYLIGCQYFEEGTQPENAVEQLVTENFIKTKYNRQLGLFEEGATTEQLEQQTQNKKSEYLNKLVTLVNNLDKRILISSVSKEESDIEYLKNQTENRYYQKYKVAKKYVDTLGLYTPILEDADWYNQIVAELENTNTIQNQNIPLSYFMNLIVQYYELGDFRNMKFQTALETFRAKTKDYILMLNFVKADECMELAETLPDAMSLEDLDNKILELNGI